MKYLENEVEITYLHTNCNFSALCSICQWIISNVVPDLCWIGRPSIIFTRGHHWSVPWSCLILSTPSHPICIISILILCSHLHL